MKQLLILILILASFIFQQNVEGQVNNDIVDYLKKEKFNLQMVELSVCLNEIYYLIENDSSFHKEWNNRLSRFFNNKLSPEVKYFRNAELVYFKEKLMGTKNKIDATKFNLTNFTFTYDFNEDGYFPELFKDYIKYPPQLDDVCIIILICFGEEELTSIQNNKIANYHFNNWFEYGFEEFRLNTNIKGKNEITKRLSNAIWEKYRNSSNELAKRTVNFLKRHQLAP